MLSLIRRLDEWSADEPRMMVVTGEMAISTTIRSAGRRTVDGGFPYNGFREAL